MARSFAFVMFVAGSILIMLPFLDFPAHAANPTCSAQQGVREYLQAYVNRLSLPLAGQNARVELGQVATLGQDGNTLKCAAAVVLMIGPLRTSETVYFDVTPTDDGDSMITRSR